MLYAYLQLVQSLLAPGIAAVFIMGVFWKRATAAGGVSGLIVGFTLGMLRLLLEVFADQMNPDSLFYQVFLAPNWLHYCIALFLLSLASIWVVSQFTEKPTPDMLRSLTYGGATPEQIATIPAKLPYQKYA